MKKYYTIYFSVLIDSWNDEVWKIPFAGKMSTDSMTMPALWAISQCNSLLRRLSVLLRMNLQQPHSMLTKQFKWSCLMPLQKTTTLSTQPEHFYALNMSATTSAKLKLKEPWYFSNYPEKDNKWQVLRSPYSSSRKRGPASLQTNAASLECKKGFHRMSSMRTDQELLDLARVTSSTFELLLKGLPDKKVKKVSKESRLFIFLMKMNTGLSISAISVRFRVHRTTSSRIFAVVLESLRAAFDRFIMWPCRDVVQNIMPEAFKSSYKDSRK